jgi:cytochrome c2
MARDVLLKMADPTAEELLLEAGNSSEVFEAQEAIKSLEGNAEALLKIDKQTLRDELQLEYAEIIQNASALNEEWLVIGGNPALGKKVVFENSKSECLRCHTIEGKGGIAGPSLDDVGSRLDGTQMLHALVSPNLEITEGFGEYSAMPPMGTLLNERELRDVVAYLTSLQAAE